MNACPLCNTPAGDAQEGSVEPSEIQDIPKDTQKHLMQQVLWQVTSILLATGILATFTINLAIQKSITWSIYPISISLIVFFYASIAALWHTGILQQLLAGWLVSFLFLIGIGWYTEAKWPLALALPLLSGVNLVGIGFMLIIRDLKTKGLNVLALILIAASILCLLIDGTISYYIQNAIRLRWSIIVTACLLPVIAAVFFMFMRLRKNRDLQKIFHT